MSTFSDIFTSKKAQKPSVFLHFWLRNVLRATNGVHFLDIFFDIWNLQKWFREMVCFVHFDLENVLRAHNGVHFFDISTSKSGPKPLVFCTFWLGNVLRATTACNFASLLWPAGSAPAALASLLFRTLRRHKSLEKHQCFATFPTFFAHL